MTTRRAFLSRSLALGCSLAASPLVTPVSFAALPGEARLVVIVLRGGMDGLGVVAPMGDPDFSTLGREASFAQGFHDLDGFFALHPALAPLLPLWRAGELGFAHAVSTPYRDKRSHFDGQDLLEAGVGSLNDKAGLRDGWLNRLVAALPGAQSDTAYAIGQDPLPLLAGAAEVQRWSPESDMVLSPQALRLARMVMKPDPAMSAALEQALVLAESDGDAVRFDGAPGDMMAMVQENARARGGAQALAAFATDRLRQEARIAAFSLNGWDTHAAQHKALPRALQTLSDALLSLRDGLGAAWDNTAVVAITEFGRTARMNGSDGTDHGTGGAMLLAGGALRGGRVIADWPGLSEAALYDRRDLQPTRDLRALCGWLLRDLFGLSDVLLQDRVFPGMDLGRSPKLIL